MKPDRLANEPEEREEYPEHCCPNCGHDLSEYRNPNKVWKSKGRGACDVCPACGVMPTWLSGETEYNDRFEVTRCDTCKEEFVQRVCYRAHHQHVRTAGMETVVRKRVVNEKFGINLDCGACRERNQADIHQARADQALTRAYQKRSSQRRGVLKLRREQAKKEKKS